MSKINSRFIAIGLTLMLALTCVVVPLCSATTAFAAPHPDGPEYTKVYYFTDYSGSAGYCSTDGLLLTPVLTYGLTANDIERHYWPNVNENNNFWTNIKAYFNIPNNLENIENAFVIVENRTGFPLEQDNGSDTVNADYLYDWFSTMKENNCKIMFISGTDETRYHNENKL